MIAILLLTSKILSGFVLGLTLSIILHALTNIGTLSIVFIIISTILAFLKLVWYYRFMGLLFVNLLFISLFLLLKLYISISAS